MVRIGAPAVLFLCAMTAGCAAPQVARPAAAGRRVTLPAVPPPLAVRCQYTALRIDFPHGRQTIDIGQFDQDEICRLQAGAFSIDCYPDGSSLNLGPDDSTDLLTDFPAWDMQPADGERQTTDSLRLYGTLFLVAGTVDRLPSALADYIESPGRHLSDALALAEALLSGKKVQLPGSARGGNFTVTIELTDDGRDKIVEALDDIGDQGGSLQTVRGPRTDDRGRSRTHVIARSAGRSPESPSHAIQHANPR